MERHLNQALRTSDGRTAVDVTLRVFFLPTSGGRTHLTAQSDIGIGSVVVAPNRPEKGVEYDENGDDEDSEAEQGEAEGCERARQSDRYEG
jgi:hypothetical protein